VPTGKGIQLITNQSPMAGPAQINQVAQDVDELLDSSVATPAALGTLPAAEKWPGRLMMARDTKGVYLYDGTAWVLWMLPWTPFNPTMTGVTLGTNAVNRHQYRIINGEVSVVGTMGLGPGGSFGDVQIPFPVQSGQTLPDLLPLGPVTWIDVSEGQLGRFSGAAFFSGSQAAANIRLAQMSSASRLVIGPPFSSRDPDAVSYSVRYPL
jgi:hypothetical protein